MFENFNSEILKEKKLQYETVKHWNLKYVDKSTDNIKTLRSINVKSTRHIAKILFYNVLKKSRL